MNEKQRIWFSYAVKERNKAFGNFSWSLYQKIRHSQGLREVREMWANEVLSIRDLIQEGVHAISNYTRKEILRAKINVAFGCLWTLHKMGEEFDPSVGYVEAASDIRHSKISFILLSEVVDGIDKELRKKKPRKDLISQDLHYIIHVSLLLAEEEAKGNVYDACMEVCRSNFTKIWAGRDENGKVKKSDGYIKPDLKQYLSSTGE